MGAVPNVPQFVKAILAKHPNTSFEIINNTSVEQFRLFRRWLHDSFHRSHLFQACRNSIIDLPFMRKSPPRFPKRDFILISFQPFYQGTSIPVSTTFLFLSITPQADACFLTPNVHPYPDIEWRSSRWPAIQSI